MRTKMSNSCTQTTRAAIGQVKKTRNLICAASDVGRFWRGDQCYLPTYVLLAARTAALIRVL